MNDVDIDLANRLGHRHLQESPYVKFGESRQAVTGKIRVSASLDAVRTKSGQRLIWMLSNLLARQFGIVKEIVICVPDSALLPGVAPFCRKSSLLETVGHTIKSIAGNAILLNRQTNPTGAVDGEIIIGRTAPAGPASFSIGVSAHGWAAFLSDPSNLPDSWGYGHSPFGPYFAACLAAAEVFKRLANLKDGYGKYIDDFTFSIWEGLSHNGIVEVQEGNWPDTPLPPVYLAGVGAVGQAAMACLLGCEGLSGYVTAIDHEAIDDTNLNRYSLATQADIGSAKIQLLKERMKGSGWTLYPYEGTWQEYVRCTGRPAQISPLKELENNGQYDLVLSCVDKNPARHAIQRYWPNYIIGGSTLGLGVRVTAYDRCSPYECLMCSNPLPTEQQETIEETAERLRHLSESELISHAHEVGSDIGALSDYLKKGKCGMPGEQELEKFRNRTNHHDWSIGFVSVAAGILLASQYVKYSITGPAAFPVGLGNTIHFSFLNPGSRWAKHMRKSDCECSAK